jgi:radical SAM protein with 4Fe4S-binding SPASM domain
MKVLLRGNNNVKEIISSVPSKTESIAYRKMKYIIEQEVDANVLLFNSVTCELLLMNKEEYDDFWISEKAITGGYVCIDEKNEYENIKKFREKQRSIKENVDKFVIFTTSECNARCYYCFENGHRLKQSMQKNIALDVSKYVMKNCNGKIHLSWFGGEPLMNLEAIDVITNECLKKNRSFYSSMISNGFLVDDDIVNKMVNNWNLRWIQITIDGTEEVYNKTKNYLDVSSGISPYNKVIDNIKMMTNKGIYVLVSLRVNKCNGESLLELLQNLFLVFRGNKYLSVMCAAIHEKKQGEYMPRTQEEEQYVRHYQELLMRRAFEMGLYRPTLPKSIRVHHCNSDSGKELIILPNGKVGWCNNYMDDGYIGSIYSDSLDENVIKKFEKRYEEEPQCFYCAIYPQCTRNISCDGSTPKCTEGQRKVALTNIELAMLNEYNKVMEA